MDEILLTFGADMDEAAWECILDAELLDLLGDYDDLDEENKEFFAIQSTLGR